MTSEEIARRVAAVEAEGLDDEALFSTATVLRDAIASRRGTPDEVEARAQLHAVEIVRLERRAASYRFDLEHQPIILKCDTCGQHFGSTKPIANCAEARAAFDDAPCSGALAPDPVKQAAYLAMTEAGIESKREASLRLAEKMRAGEVMDDLRIIMPSSIESAEAVGSPGG